MQRSVPAERRLVVAANRGPVSFHSDPSGEPVVTRGPGGLVTVLTEVLRKHAGTWVAAALAEEESHLAAAGGAVEVELGRDTYRVRYVAIEPDVYHKYYNIVANPMLWFIQHYLWDLGRHPDISANETDAWETGYLPVQRAFAAAIVDEADEAALIMLHDYHLYGVAPHVRRALPGAFLHQFVHIPWVQSDAWLVLPEALRTAVFMGLLGNDIVAFHTRHYASNFLQGCVDLLDLPVDERRSAVLLGDREVWVRAYPVSIDPMALMKAATSQRVAAEERALLERRREFLLLRVDRLDPSKNIIRGFLAFDRFLELHPEFKDHITFLALLQPSREDVEEYVIYREHVLRTVEQINTKHGNTDWMPIDLRVQDNFPQTLAAYRHYDALLVNAIFDGMNLVAKEGPVLNAHDGVLVLSENTGASEELGAFAVSVNPFDIEEQAAAIFEALTMRADEKRLRAQQIRRVVDRNSIEKWVDAQFADIAAKLAAAEAAG
ncbi:MAG: trehalose-6-phosphate synthase [Thermoleophilia bacterium]